MNVSSWLRTAKSKINALDAELILLDVICEKDRTFLVAHSERELSKEELGRAKLMLEKRVSGEPLAYLLGYKEFYGRKFLVAVDDRRVLIPRVETEKIIDIVKSFDNNPKKIIDVGTGSGCIAISLKLEIDSAEVLASDISNDALTIARKNAGRLKTDVKFLQADLLDGVDGCFDVIVANLPYVDEKWDWLDKEALSFEPKEALYAEDNGLYLIKKLIFQAQNRTEYLILESDTSQQEEITEYAKKHGFKLIGKYNFITVFKTEG